MTAQVKNRKYNAACVTVIIAEAAEELEKFSVESCPDQKAEEAIILLTLHLSWRLVISFI